MSTAAVRDIRNHPEGKDREAKTPNRRRSGLLCAYNRHRGQGRTRRKGVPAQEVITRRILACPMQVIDDYLEGERRGATLFGFTLPSTAWELGVKLFYIQPILTSPPPAREDFFR